VLAPAVPGAGHARADAGPGGAHAAVGGPEPGRRAVTPLSGGRALAIILNWFALQLFGLIFGCWVAKCFRGHHVC
jgi:hypothetical protein